MQNTIRKLHILFSIVLSIVLVTQGTSTLSTGHLFHNNTAYYPETFTLSNASNFPFPANRVIELAGLRINLVVSGISSPTIYTRCIFKSNYSLRAGSTHKNTILMGLVLKIILEQSWIATYLSENSELNARTLLTTSGPAFDSSHSNINEVTSALIIIKNGINNGSISSQELSTMKSNLRLQHDNLNQVPRFVADDVFSQFTATPSQYNLLDTGVYAVVRGFPYQGISKLTLDAFTIEECHNFMRDWARSPLEILLIDGTNRSDTDLIDVFSSLWHVQLPKTNYHSNGRNTTFTTNGEEIHIPCYLGNPINEDFILVVNLGPLSKETLIAADLVRTQFQTYATSNGSPIPNSTNYRIEWAPCAGCAVIMIRLGTDAPVKLLNGINQIGMIRLSFDQFRNNFTTQEIANNLIDNWSSSLGANQVTRNYNNWSSGNTNIEKLLGWWSETFGGGESAFEDLEILRAGFSNGQAAGSLYDDIRDIIEDSFTATSLRFDIWHFQRG
ncbi:hypothetical protein [Candidatus Similichlamydia epinepheli]|uniref:hypothetical protein n=1 Tax=Candidatus Similichlamydia epinepheli TaxID=1903953 RepID=UPI000D3D8BBF|nr:hypothetical protein [Candidatus Similichlamydia epinepheli]